MRKSGVAVPLLVLTVLLAVLLAVLLTVLSVTRPARKKTVCIVMFGTSDIMRQYGDIAVTINRAYADRHGYVLVVEEAPAPMDRAEAAWKTVEMIRKNLLPSYDAVMWIDCDAVFNPARHGTSLERLLASSREDALACRDAPPLDRGVNAGVLFFKNTPWSRDFLDRWWAMREDPVYARGLREQAALNDLLMNKDAATKFGVREAIEFNYIPDDARRTNAFVIHLAGTDGEYRRRELTNVLEKLEKRA